MVAFLVWCIFICVLWAGQGQCLKFPDDFKFGVTTAAYQIEGAWNESGKGESIWDHFAHSSPSPIRDYTTGDLACDSYHQISTDIRNLQWLGVDFYRFSLSWTRLLPSGFANQVNPAGVEYYNRLIDALIEANITPVVTVFHWDLPQSLQDLGGWPNQAFVDVFVDYARVVFGLFGDRVKMWITFNEPSQFCQGGYGGGGDAPGVDSDGIGVYLCGKTIFLAHAKAYRMYHKEFYNQQKGQVGITFVANWFEPATNTSEDFEAAERCMQMTVGMWAHPIFSKKGDFPTILKQRIATVSKQENYPRSRLPAFTKEEISSIQGTFDFLGLNHYSTRLASSNTSSITWKTPSYRKDIGINFYFDPKWPPSAAPWLKKVPWGFRKLLAWLKNEYDNPVVYITENGYADLGEMHDQNRIDYIREYLQALLEAIQIDGCDVRGYAAWTLMDNFEWAEGFTKRFGLFYTNISTPERIRTPKDSAYFYKQLIKDKIIDDQTVKIVTT